MCICLYFQDNLCQRYAVDPKTLTHGCSIGGYLVDNVDKFINVDNFVDKSCLVVDNLLITRKANI